MTDKEHDDPDLGLDVDADDYATTAAHDAPTASARTAQSEEAFEAQRASYDAKIDSGKIYQSLPAALPPLGSNGVSDMKPTLDKKHAQLITAAVGELYYFYDFERVLETITWLKQGYNLRILNDKKGRFIEALDRWEQRARERLQKGAAKQPA